MLLQTNILCGAPFYYSLGIFAGCEALFWIRYKASYERETNVQNVKKTYFPLCLVSLWCDLATGGSIVIQTKKQAPGASLKVILINDSIASLHTSGIFSCSYICFHKIRINVVTELDRLCLHLLATQSLVCLEIITRDQEEAGVSHQPIRGQYSGHVTRIDQSEAS